MFEAQCGPYTKDGFMASLFNYNTLKVSLKKETRTLVVELNRPENQNAINTEMIFELEGLLKNMLAKPVKGWFGRAAKKNGGHHV